MTKTPADRLKAMRESRGYTTAKDAADAFGWNPVTYRSHENGVRNIPYGAAQKYGAAYGVKAAAILSGEDSGPQPIVNSVINVGLVGTVSAGVFREGNGLEDMEILVPAVPRSDIPASAQYCVRVDGPSVNLGTYIRV
jgi:transcriptional regulator with XRE-family HTH domain